MFLFIIKVGLPKSKPAFDNSNFLAKYKIKVQMSRGKLYNSSLFIAVRRPVCDKYFEPEARTAPTWYCAIMRTCHGSRAEPAIFSAIFSTIFSAILFAISPVAGSIRSIRYRALYILAFQETVKLVLVLTPLALVQSLPLNAA